VVMWQHMFSMPVMLTVWRRELDSGWGAAFSCTGILFLDLYRTWWRWLYKSSL